MSLDKSFNIMGAKKLSFDFAINPLEESIAYETLMALQGMTEAKLEKKFPSIPDQKTPCVINDSYGNSTS